MINQVDELRFNRASLINVGFLLCQDDCDYIAMHDVDLLPLNLNLDYGYPEKGPYHVAAPHLHPKYHYRKFVGGILLLKREHFKQVNGMSNKFWGWGREDDELYLRMKQAGLIIYRPGNLTTDSETTFKHTHEKKVHPRDKIKYGDQRKEGKKLDNETGLDTVKYKEINRYDININGAPGTVINVELQCDVEVTSWCMKPEQLDEVRKSMENDHKEAEVNSVELIRQKLLKEIDVAQGVIDKADSLEETVLETKNIQT